MPKTIHGRPVNESKWKRATELAAKSVDKNKSVARFYAVAMQIYLRMIGED